MVVPEGEVAIDFYKKFELLLEEYTKAKEAIILAEKFDPNEEIYVAPLNELRSAFDHIMRARSNPAELDKQFDEALTHVRRAGYDAFELFSSNIILQQIKTIKKFNSIAISHIFPEYYTYVCPIQNEIKTKIADTRTHRKIISAANSVHFADYFSFVEKLINIDNMISEKIPALTLFIEQNRSETRKRKFWYWICTISVSIIIGALFFYLGRHYK